MVRYKDKEYVCYLDLGIEFLRGKWKALILCHLTHEPVRFLELQRRTKGITQKMLNEQLKALEKDGLVDKKIYPETPPKVEYFLTEKGEALSPALKTIEIWAKKYFSEDE